MFGIGHTELIIILGIVVVLFGGSRIPSLARSLGASIKEFKRGQNEDDTTPTPAETSAKS